MGSPLGVSYIAYNTITLPVARLRRLVRRGPVGVDEGAPAGRRRPLLVHLAVPLGRYMKMVRLSAS